MRDELRAAIAGIVIAATSGRSVGSVYDYGSSTYRRVSGNINSNGGVQFFDYDRSCHISGTLVSVFDYGDSHHVSLSVSGNSFSGFDYGSSSHFSGSVSGRNANIYDYGISEHRSYSA